MKIYRVMRLSDELFSCGTTSVRFTKNGKFWTSKKNLWAHFNLFPDPMDYPYRDCVIVEYYLDDFNHIPLGKF